VVGVIQKLMDAGHLEPDVRDVVEGEIHSQYLSARARASARLMPEFDLDAGSARRSRGTAISSRGADVIKGVELHPLRQIPDERGKVMHMLRRDDSLVLRIRRDLFFCRLPGVIKAWHLHRRMTLNYAYRAAGSSSSSSTIATTRRRAASSRRSSPARTPTPRTVAAGIWNGFKGRRHDAGDRRQLRDGAA